MHDDHLEENIILQIRLSALDFQRANESITYEMLTQEKVNIDYQIHFLLYRFVQVIDLVISSFVIPMYCVCVIQFFIQYHSLSALWWLTDFAGWSINDYLRFTKTKSSQWSKWLKLLLFYPNRDDHLPIDQSGSLSPYSAQFYSLY